MESALLGDALGNVHLGPQTPHAHVGRVGRNGHAALATETGREEKTSNSISEVTAKRTLSSNGRYAEGFYFFFYSLPPPKKNGGQENRQPPPRFIANRILPRQQATLRPGRRHRLHVALGGGRRPRHVLHVCSRTPGPASGRERKGRSSAAPREARGSEKAVPSYCVVVCECRLGVAA